MTTDEVIKELDQLFDDWFSSKISPTEYKKAYQEVLKQFTKEESIEFACVCLIGTGQLKDEDLPTLREQIQDFYDSDQWRENWSDYDEIIKPNAKNKAI